MKKLLIFLAVFVLSACNLGEAKVKLIQPDINARYLTVGEQVYLVVIDGVDRFRSTSTHTCIDGYLYRSENLTTTVNNSNGSSVTCDSIGTVTNISSTTIEITY